MTKVMPRTPVGTEVQEPIVLTIRYDIHNKKQSYPISKCFLHSGIKTLFMKVVNLKAIISILAKKGKTFFCVCVSVLHHFLQQWWCLHWGCQLVWPWRGWHTAGAARTGGKGCPRATCPGGTSKVPPRVSLPSWLQVLTVIWPKWRGKQLSVLGKVSKQTPRKRTVSFQPLSRNWWILDHANWILSGFTVQHCWKGLFVALLWFRLCQVLPRLDSTPGILLLCITWMYWPNIQYCR